MFLHTLGQDETAAHVLQSRRSQALRAPTQQDLTDHNYINVRVPTDGGLYAWEFEKDKREPKDASSECSRIGVRLFRDTTFYCPNRRQSSPAFALLVDALRYRS